MHTSIHPLVLVHEHILESHFWIFFYKHCKLLIFEWRANRARVVSLRLLAWTCANQYMDYTVTIHVSSTILSSSRDGVVCLCMAGRQFSKPKQLLCSYLPEQYRRLAILCYNFHFRYAVSIATKPSPPLSSCHAWVSAAEGAETAEEIFSEAAGAAYEESIAGTHLHSLPNPNS